MTITVVRESHGRRHADRGGDETRRTAVGAAHVGAVRTSSPHAGSCSASTIASSNVLGRPGARAWRCRRGRRGSASRRRQAAGTLLSGPRKGEPSRERSRPTRTARARTTAARSPICARRLGSSTPASRMRGGDRRARSVRPSNPQLARFELAATAWFASRSTGTPAASDSTTASPKLSESEHWTITSASFSSAHLSAPLTAPVRGRRRRARRAAQQIRDQTVLVVARRARGAPRDASRAPRRRPPASRSSRLMRCMRPRNSTTNASARDAEARAIAADGAAAPRRGRRRWARPRPARRA